VRLWIDDLETAGKLIPGLDPELSQQTIAGVEICQWDMADQALPADVVIEAFACELPSAYLEKMAAKQPKWINLEYLSAEPWVESFHAQESRHPTLPLTKHFYFPGFTSKTGGLPREYDLLVRRDEFQNSPSARRAFKEQFHIPDSDGLTISLFCYRHAPVADLLQAFAHSSQPVLCLVPESGIWPAICQYFNTPLKLGESVNRGSFTLLPLPFLSQDDYDRLLWLSDVNFVRGEDSWVRAIWAGKPMIWQPYRQQEGTHLDKLAAFLNTYSVSLNLTASAAMQKCHESWSSDTFPEAVCREYLEHLPVLEQHAAAFSTKLAMQSDLASKLVIFCGNSP
jgi:uncharacterized repeat protein (TIGR03837 family)